MKRIIRLPVVLERTGIESVVQLGRLEKRGLFPRRLKLVPGSGQRGAVGWIESEIDAWIAERAASRDQAA